MLFNSAKQFIEDIQKWSRDEVLKNRVRLVVDGGNYIMFFQYKGRYFGTNEPNRVTYAKLAGKDEEEGWQEIAFITATDLINQVNGTSQEAIFGKDDIQQIQIIKDVGEVKEKLLNAIKGDNQ